MEYMLFICTDPTAPAYVAAEDNIVEWGAEMEARGVIRMATGCDLSKTQPRSRYAAAR
ncbi:hypothetical protein AB4Y67_11805 [Arthrobacter sp. YAF17]|uniref:hypothetical protein n=1 Tax=Arthrobacter sp. YAF17 TaxID=3233077 RepID=UPI003F8EFD9C